MTDDTTNWTITPPQPLSELDALRQRVAGLERREDALEDSLRDLLNVIHDAIPSAFNDWPRGWQNAVSIALALLPTE